MRNGLGAVLLVGVLLPPALLGAESAFAQTKTARVAVLSVRPASSEEETRRWYEPLTRALAERGWVEGTNLSLVFTGTGGSMRDTAQELVEQKVDLILADSAPATRAAFSATKTIPIVAIDLTNDPVAAGYAESYGRPGKNLTGVFLDAPEFAGKWFDLLTAVVPRLTRVTALYDPTPGPAHLQAAQAAARARGIQLTVTEVHGVDELDRAFANLRKHGQAAILLPAPLMYAQAERMGRLAMKHRLPATSMAGGFAEAGGAMSYGPVQAAVYERAGAFVAQILSGSAPGELPIERPARFALIVNLKSAERLGLKVSETVLLGADKVIR